MLVLGRLFLILFCVCCAPISAAQGERLVLAYPEREKRPFSAEAPNNEGIYQDVLEAAAHKLGVQLVILRLPKKRIFRYMREGRVDLYPGSLIPERSDTMLWIRFGFKSQHVCIVRNDVPRFASLASAPPLRLIHEVGDSRATYSRIYPNVRALEVAPRISLADAVRLLSAGHGDLYVTEREAYLNYLQRQQIPSLARFGLRYQEDCIGPERDYLLGVAERFAAYGNPDYRPEQPMSIDNQPLALRKDSLAVRLRDTLAAMQACGETQRLVERWLVPAPYSAASTSRTQ